MALAQVTLNPREGDLPAAVTSLLVDADRRIDAFLESSAGQRTPAFVPSDFEQVYQALRAVAEDQLAPGRYFCEWGSGFGVVTVLAALLNFRASGIEFEKSLVTLARKLAADHEVGVEFASGNFIPAGGEEHLAPDQDFCWLVEGGPCGHEELGLDPDDFDLIFAYPWPGESQVIFDLFDHFAADGSLLLVFQGREGVEAYRKLESR